ncbi:MAG: hypothetical protein JXB39_16935 [Deltaproteobacteria bacterium]|nr:hypothetical protein [Deltaproteobacteria bacterium]
MGTVLEAILDPSDPDGTACAEAHTGDPPPPPPRPLAEYAGPILERSLFDSSKVGGGGVDSEGIRRTTLDLVLVGTAVTDPPEYSSALIGTPQSRSVRLNLGKRRRTVRTTIVEDATGYGVGDALADDATIVAIEPGQVTLERSDGQQEVLLLWSPEEQGAAPIDPTSVVNVDDGVERLSSNHFAVAREVLDALAEEPGALAELGRATPHRSSAGEGDGVRLTGIRRSSLGYKVGLRNRDVLHSVNGRTLLSQDQVLEAFRASSGASSVEIRLTRRRRQRTIRIDVR